MENASKALLMAGGVLIGLIIIGAFVLMMSTLTDYQDKSDQKVADKQVVEFNNQFTTYDRTNLRGNDMVSLMNRVVDYNKNNTSQGFTEMKITINMNGQRTNLKYGSTNIFIMQDEYNEDNISNIVGTPNSNDGVREIENKYGQKYISGLTSDISEVEAIYNGTGNYQNMLAPDRLVIFNDMKYVNYEVKKVKSSNTDKYSIQGIFYDAQRYYEYVQFKRAKFDCIDRKYDSNTGRIIEMSFNCTGIGV